MPNRATNSVERFERDLELVCTAQEAGQLLGVSQERINQFCIEGRLVAKRPGRDWIISRRSAEALAKIPRPAGGARPRKPAKRGRR